QHGPELHLLAHFTLDPLNADGVAGCDTILLSPGLYNGVHLSSKASRQTTIILGPSPHGQRASRNAFEALEEHRGRHVKSLAQSLDVMFIQLSFAAKHLRHQTLGTKQGC